MSNTAVKAAPGVTHAKAEIEEESSSVLDEVRTARESAEAKADELARHKEGEIRQSVEIAMEQRGHSGLQSSLEDASEGRTLVRSTR